MGNELNVDILKILFDYSTSILFNFNKNLDKGDLLIDEKITLEVGGKNKKKKQVLDIENAYIAKDQIEIGFDNMIPVWFIWLFVLGKSSLQTRTSKNVDDLSHYTFD